MGAGIIGIMLIGGVKEQCYKEDVQQHTKINKDNPTQIYQTHANSATNSPKSDSKASKKIITKYPQYSHFSDNSWTTI